ncbi:MAG: metallophosphoesterase [Bacillota bacterium]|nr:metallophosphoesterase [Bacillota bacterium]
MTIQNIAYKILGALFFVVAIALYGGLNYYIGKRIWLGLFRHVSFVNIKVYWVIYWAIVLCYIPAMVLRNHPGRILSLMELMGGIWMGVMFYLFIAFLVIDLIRLLLRKAGSEGVINMMASGSFQVVFSIVIGIIVVFFVAYGMREASISKVSTYNFDVSKPVQDSNMKIVMISDIHIGGIIGRSRVENMVKEINSLNPDLVLFAGDIIDSSLEPFKEQNMGEVFRQIKSSYGVYGCLGNHEGFDGNVGDIVKEYDAAGIRILQDEAVLVNNSVYVAGRVDASIARGKGRKKISEILTGIDKSKPVIMLDHQPLEFSEEDKEGVDLLLCGHTHRGQLAPANLITHRIYELDYGYLKKGNLNIVVSSGYGTWGPPMRIGSQSEIVEINLGH